jgi:hypothetical protein
VCLYLLRYELKSLVFSFEENSKREVRGSTTQPHTPNFNPHVYSYNPS